MTGNDETLLAKFHQHNDKSPHFHKPKVSSSTFSVIHYAGKVFSLKFQGIYYQVEYNCLGFMEKNKQTVPQVVMTFFSSIRK